MVNRGKPKFMMQDYHSTRILWKGLGLNLDNLFNYTTLNVHGPSVDHSNTVQMDGLFRQNFFYKKHVLKQSRIDEEKSFPNMQWQKKSKFPERLS